jgi:hypothetical protein
MNNREFDEALDYARNYARTNKFCGKMVKQFDYIGRLTEGQVRALLRIKADNRAA